MYAYTWHNHPYQTFGFLGWLIFLPELSVLTFWRVSAPTYSHLTSVRMTPFSALSLCTSASDCRVNVVSGVDAKQGNCRQYFDTAACSAFVVLQVNRV